MAACRPWTGRLRLSRLDELLTYCRAERRVCPVPATWQKLWLALPRREQIGSWRQPPLPLILAGWWMSTDSQKARRLEEHIRWADANGALEKIDAMLRSLPEGEWHKVDRRVGVVVQQSGRPL